MNEIVEEREPFALAKNPIPEKMEEPHLTFRVEKSARQDFGEESPEMRSLNRL
jgi:hypothetical protein